MNTAELVRIFEPNPDDDYVTKRDVAMKEVADKILAAVNVDALFAFADSMVDGIAKGKIKGALESAAVSALSTASSAFVAEGQDTQVLVCAIGACMKILAEHKPHESGRGRGDVFSAALHSGLSFLQSTGQARLDQALAEVLDASASAFRTIAEISRNRKAVPDLKISVDPNDVAAAVAKKLISAANGAISILRANSALDREELDLLWFCLSDHSAALNARMSSLKAPLGLVASTLETIKLLRRIPSAAHVHMAMRNIAVGEPRTLKELVLETEGHRQQFLDYLGDDRLSQFPSLFPAVASILGYSNAYDTKSLLPEDWGRRLLLELGLTKFYDEGVI